MANALSASVLQEAIWKSTGSNVWIKRVALVVLGIAVLALSAKLKVAVPGSPVPVTMGTFAVLSIGAAYGPRLGLVTVLGYMLLGAVGVAVFAGESAGIVYMQGGTGGYLLGYVLATIALGAFARKGWDRNILMMAVAMIVGNLLIYVPGLLWLNGFAASWAQTFEWGLTPFVIGDLMKLALAALLFPAIWKLVGKARS